MRGGFLGRGRDPRPFGGAGQEVREAAQARLEELDGRSGHGFALECHRVQ